MNTFYSGNLTFIIAKKYKATVSDRNVKFPPLLSANMIDPL